MTPALQPQEPEPPGLADIPSEIGRLQNTLYGKKRWNILWGTVGYRNILRALVREPQGLPSQRHRKDTVVTALGTEWDREAHLASAHFCPVIDSKEIRLGMRKCLHQSFPWQELGNLLYWIQSFIHVFWAQLLGVYTCRIILSVWRIGLLL